MTNDIFVTYDGTTLSPTPIVNYSSQPINLGYVYGYNTDITLEGLYSGITTTGAAISYLTGVFANQFRGLVVKDDVGNTLYSWTGVTVDSVSIEPNNYFLGSFVKYSVRLKSFDFPSGVIDPSNEYAYSQSEDGTVNISHKMSARCVRNVSGAFNNAIAFIRQFTGAEPFSNCAPYFVAGGSGVLLSINENINRADGVYSVTESYKYTTGAFLPYVKTATLDFNESIESEFRVIDYSVKFQGSPISKNTNQIISSLSYNVLNDIQNDFGYNTSNWVKNTYSANVDSGSAAVDIKIGYLSGASYTGFFDYTVNFDYDILTNTESWKVDGDFRCFGPFDYRFKELQVFKSSNSSNSWRDYLSGLISSSPLWSNHFPGQLFSPNLRVSVNENTGLATLRLSLEMIAGYEPLGLSDLKYSVEGSPSRWIYELLPSSTIEGSYIIQDLQMQSQARQKISISSKTSQKDFVVSGLRAYASSWSNSSVISGSNTSVTAFLSEENLSTGTFDNMYSMGWIGQDNGLSSGVLSLQAIGTNNNNVPIRNNGYNFGY